MLEPMQAFGEQLPRSWSPRVSGPAVLGQGSRAAPLGQQLCPCVATPCSVDMHGRPPALLLLLVLVRRGASLADAPEPYDGEKVSSWSALPLATTHPDDEAASDAGTQSWAGWAGWASWARSLPSQDGWASMQPEWRRRLDGPPPGDGAWASPSPDPSPSPSPAASPCFDCSCHSLPPAYVSAGVDGNTTSPFFADAGKSYPSDGCYNNNGEGNDATYQMSCNSRCEALPSCSGICGRVGPSPHLVG